MASLYLGDLECSCTNDEQRDQVCLLDTRTAMAAKLRQSPTAVASANEKKERTDTHTHAKKK